MRVAADVYLEATQAAGPEKKADLLSKAILTRLQAAEALVWRARPAIRVLSTERVADDLLFEIELNPITCLTTVAQARRSGLESSAMRAKPGDQGILHIRAEQFSLEHCNEKTTPATDLVASGPAQKRMLQIASLDIEHPLRLAVRFKNARREGAPFSINYGRFRALLIRPEGRY